MLVAVARHPFLVRAPAELGWLHALGDEALNRPGIDEDILGLRPLADLGVALGDVDALDAGLLGKLTPFLARLRLLELETDILGDVDQRLLDEPGHHPRIGAAAGYGGGAAWVLAARRQYGFAQRVIRTRFRAQFRVEVEARPRLDHGVDVKR